ncbi:orotate phosphoribosyltransferase [Thermodesulfitimonas autotrophica]|uniref:Orotate phosphoribosyltransferase n=1 Tax=Thermodesulfitimonas autotrophica TaxID=1894989 RepID=A0A3N5ADY7_9THEO|nr:orotate phosphoribosyltransferase [Thermodesulfitimonas autotrophica]RPF43076.1 orotate phosphoribosyltransferase [Thermodesulfitimonas autotrophica]
MGFGEPGEAEIRQIFEKSGAILSGHFILTSGRHSDTYVQCALVLQYPELAAQLCGVLAERFRGLNVNCVVGPALGGIIIAYEVARALGVRGIFTERVEGVMRLRRGFTVAPGERVLVVEDVVTTGGSVKEAAAAVAALGGEVVGFGALIDRSGGQARFDAPFAALLKVGAVTWEPDACPLCRQGVPAVKPGSRGLGA